ncbi:TetR/AcrR family transcriptional regulator [Streptomyces sp. NPDC059783]|uniref:TetR/AcrR family transcriptional regulator n=1 Tax=Streptomyces sp. NPDC059783 TaxID=3346944 RepID=UPI0036475D0F
MTTGPGQDVPSPRRTDARLNRERLVAAAHEEFTEAGPDASLNAIARRAGVGPGTLYRHFPNRRALLTAVLADRIRTLCERAEAFSATYGPDEALARWLDAFLAHARANQGIGGALLIDGAGEPDIDCHRLILEAADQVLVRAQREGAVRPDLTAEDLIRLVTGIALATARDIDEEPARRLLRLVRDAAHARPRPVSED